MTRFPVSGGISGSICLHAVIFEQLESRRLFAAGLSPVASSAVCTCSACLASKQAVTETNVSAGAQALSTATALATETRAVGADGKLIPSTRTLTTAINKTLRQTGLTRSFKSVDALIRPSKAAKSYLHLDAYTPFKIDYATLKRTLANAPTQAEVAVGTDPLRVALPTPDGRFAKFDVVKSDMTAGGLAALGTDIQVFCGQGVDDPTATLAMDFTTQGFHASVAGTAGSYLIDPLYHLAPEGGSVAYWTYDNFGDGRAFACLTSDAVLPPPRIAARNGDGTTQPAFASEPPLTAAPVPGFSLTGTTLRTYTLAVSTTPSYTKFHAGGSGNTAGALSAVVTAVTRLNQVYERDFAIRLELVANESSFLFTDNTFTSNTNPTPFVNSLGQTTAGNASTANNQNQAWLDSVLGDNGYDIGHVFHLGSNNGLAGDIGNVGVNGEKAKGYSSFSNPIGDNFVIDYVAHEMGHQFGGRHPYNNISNSFTGPGPTGNPTSNATSNQGDNSDYANEIGSGQTIMGYAGIGQPSANVLAHSLPQFQANNYLYVDGTGAYRDQIYDYTLGNTASPGYTSATRTATGNTPPALSTDGSAYNIPVNTPFALTASASDDNGDTVTYSWEQLDGGNPVKLNTVSGVTFVPDDAALTGPTFRVLAPTTNGTRSFPNLSAVLAGRNYAQGESVPSVARTMRFAAVARDNRAGAGGVSIGLVTLNTVANSAFAVNSFNAPATVAGGSSQTITWTNNNTGVGTTINAGSVNILLSTDDGQSFPITLAGNTANDGSETVLLPFDLGTSAARIKIVPTNNVFYDINNVAFTITSTPSTSVTPGTPGFAAGLDSGVAGDNKTNINNVTGKELSFTVPGTVAGATVELYVDGTLRGTAVGQAGGTTIALTAGTLTDGEHTVQARQTEPGKAASGGSGIYAFTIDTAAARVTGVLVDGTGAVSGTAAWTTGFRSYLAANGLGSNQTAGSVSLGGYTLPANGTTRTLPWQNIDTIRVRFDGPVSIPTAQALLATLGVSAGYTVSSFRYDENTAAGLYEASFTFNNVLTTDKLRLTLNDSAVVDAAANALDGEAGAFPTGNGAAGGNFVYRINVLPGDFDGSGLILSNDVLATRSRQLAGIGDAAYSPFADFDGNGIVLSNDVLFARSRQLTGLPTGEPGGSGQAARGGGAFVAGNGSTGGTLDSAGSGSGRLAAGKVATGVTSTHGGVWSSFGFDSDNRREEVAFPSGLL